MPIFWPNSAAGRRPPIGSKRPRFAVSSFIPGGWRGESSCWPRWAITSATCDRQHGWLISTAQLRLDPSEVALALGMMSNSLLSPGRLIEIARQACAVNPAEPWRRLPLALAYYRAGHYRDALLCLGGNPPIDDRLETPIRAMAEWRLGAKDEAKKSLARADDYFKAWCARPCRRPWFGVGQLVVRRSAARGHAPRGPPAYRRPCARRPCGACQGALRDGEPDRQSRLADLGLRSGMAARSRERLLPQGPGIATDRIGAVEGGGAGALQPD